ncbi:MAG: hypothetical protein WBM13_06295 [Bacteroidia bacterium]
MKQENKILPVDGNNKVVKCNPDLLHSQPDSRHQQKNESPEPQSEKPKMKSSPDELRKLINETPKRKSGATVAKLSPEKPEAQFLKQALSAIEPAHIQQYEKTEGKLEAIHEHKLLYKGQLNHYYVLGTLSQDLNNLIITLMVEDPFNGRKERIKIDLYERNAICEFAQQLSDLFGENTKQVETELFELTDLLEIYREQQLEQCRANYQPEYRASMPMTVNQQKQAVDILSKPKLIQTISQLIADSGLVGEERNALLLFIAASTYKMQQPLHVVVQGEAGSGKNYLVNHIAQCFPPEDVFSLTRATSNSFYHYRNELLDKLLVMRDYDSLDAQARKALTQLQDTKAIELSTTGKDKYGNITSSIKNIRSHFASMLVSESTNIVGEALTICIDESEEQTKKVISYQNKKLAGAIDSSEEQKAKQLLQNCTRSIKTCEVINPYADKVSLPFDIKMLRKLNMQYQAFVRQITLLHQYQRKRDAKGRLIVEPEDLRLAAELLFGSIQLSADTMNPALKQFFKDVKQYVCEKQKEEGQATSTFNHKELREALNMSKAACFKKVQQLEVMGYVQKSAGFANKGFSYTITHWDDQDKIRVKIQKQLSEQLEQLKQL